MTILLLVLLSTGRMVASDWLDRVLSSPVLVLPLVSYSSETSWGFGAGVGGYFRLPTDSIRQRWSEVNVYGMYTLRKQWNLNATLSFYINERWQLNSQFSFRHYPDHYYGVGNDPEQLIHDEEGHISYETFTSDRYRIFVQPLYAVLPNLHVGPLVDWRYETKGLHGMQYCLLGIGSALEYDTRDSKYYPHHGMFLKAEGSYMPDLVSHDHLGHVQIDFRHYVTIWRELIFAYQLYGEGLYGEASRDKLAQLMPTLGGDELLRGFYHGMFRDNTFLMGQAELRFPIWSIFRGCAFVGIGDVYDATNWQWAVPKVGYGLGLRLQVNQAGIDIRFDVARNNIETSWRDLNSYYFYLQVKEAF